MAIAQEKDPEVLDKAIILTDLKTVKMVIDNGAFIRPSHMEIAISRGKIDVVKLLLKKVPDLIYAKNEYHETPLHVAARSGQMDIAHLLINSGSDVNAEARKGETPLHRAAQEGKSHVASLLLKKGANINARDKKGETPLHYSIRRRKAHMASFLLEKGADMNAKNKKGISPAQLILHNVYDTSLFCESLFRYFNDEGFFCEISPQNKKVNCYNDNNYDPYTYTPKAGFFSFLNEFLTKSTFSESEDFSKIKNACETHNKVICKNTTSARKEVYCDNGKSYSPISPQSVHSRKRFEGKESGVESQNQNEEEEESPSSGILP